MKLCRSSMAPRMLAQCSSCDEQRFVPHSCGHRNCPDCQHFESKQWIERQTWLLVPGSYFLVTFTLPAELRGLASHHERVVYAKLMECAWATLSTFSQNHKHLQGSPGAVAVLHTHSRKLLHANSKRLIALLKRLVFKLAPSKWSTPTPRAQWVCPCCGAPMVIVKRRIPPSEIDDPAGATPQQQQELAL